MLLWLDPNGHRQNHILFPENGAQVLTCWRCRCPQSERENHYRCLLSTTSQLQLMTVIWRSSRFFDIIMSWSTQTVSSWSVISTIMTLWHEVKNLSLPCTESPRWGSPINGFTENNSCADTVVQQVHCKATVISMNVWQGTVGPASQQMYSYIFYRSQTTFWDRVPWPATGLSSTPFFHKHRLFWNCAESVTRLVSCLWPFHCYGFHCCLH